MQYHLAKPIYPPPRETKFLADFFCAESSQIAFVTDVSKEIPLPVARQSSLVNIGRLSLCPFISREINDENNRRIQIGDRFDLHANVLGSFGSTDSRG